MDQLLTVSCPVPPVGGDETRWDLLPAGRGVVVFEDGRGVTSLVATSASVRALARRRLDPDDTASRGATNLRAVTRLVRAAPTGSAFESDLLYLELARDRLAHVYRSVTDRWRGWFVEVETGSRFPRFAKVSTGALDESASGRTLVGPLADKHAAGRFVELLEDLFDLCRYHSVLVQAPHGSACVYKEMGKCPAPCDGSETMASYRARVLEAVGFARDPDAFIGASERAMRDAGEALDFERAERLRRWIERASEARGGKFRGIGDLHDMRMVAIAPSERSGFSRLILISGGRWRVGMDVRQGAVDEGVIDAACEGIERLGWSGFTRAELDRLGLVCSWLGRSAKARRGVRFIRVDDRNGTALREAIRKGAGTPEPDEEASREIGPMLEEEVSDS